MDGHLRPELVPRSHRLAGPLLHDFRAHVSRDCKGTRQARIMPRIALRAVKSAGVEGDKPKSEVLVVTCLTTPRVKHWFGWTQSKWYG